MRLIGIVLMGATALMAGEKKWKEAKVESVEYETSSPVGEQGAKAVEYTMVMPDGARLQAYHVSYSVFSGYRKDLSKAGSTARVSLKSGTCTS